jgi:outer membrane protein TolC
MAIAAHGRIVVDLNSETPDMPVSMLPPQWLRRTLIPVVPLVLLASCQSYEPAPLNITQYEHALGLRVIEIEPIEAFSRRLAADDDDVPTAFDLSDGISYAEGEVIALFYNPDLRIARLEAGVAMANRDTAGLWEDPVFGFDGAEIVSPSSPFEFGLMGSLTIPISGRLEIEKVRASAAYETQLRTLVDAEWRTRAALRTAWTRWTAIAEQATLFLSMTHELERINVIATHLEFAGEINRIERRLLLIELADIQLRSTEIDLELINAETNLIEILGVTPHAAAQLIPAFPDVSIPAVTDTTARLIASNTELAVHFAAYQTAEETLRLEIRKQFPDIVIGSGYGTEFNDHRVMFGLSIPIPILNANRAAIAEARANREVVRAKAETTFSRLNRSLIAAQAALHTNQAQRDQYEQLIVPMLDEQSRDIDRIAELGELDVFVLLQTVTRTLKIKQKLIALRVDEIEAATTLRRILGPDNAPNPTPIENHAGDLVAGGNQ